MASRDLQADAQSRVSTSPAADGRLSGGSRLLAALTGVAALAAGIAAIFTVSGSGGAGAAALLAIGVAAVWLAVVAVVPLSVKVAGVEMTLPEKANRLAEEAFRAGRPDVGDVLKGVSAQLAATAEPFSQVYEAVREIAPSGEQRTTALDALVRVVEEQAASGRWSPSEIRVLFESGHDGARVFALAMMRGAPRAADFDLAERAVTESRSAFEQWHGLIVIERMLDGLPVETLSRLERVLPEIDFRGDSVARRQLRDRILARSNPRETESRSNPDATPFRP